MSVAVTFRWGLDRLPKCQHGRIEGFCRCWDEVMLLTDQLPNGLTYRSGRIWFDCRVCGEANELPVDQSDWDLESDGNVCGRSPRCCP